MLAVFRRELAAYFASPIGFTFIGFFILLAGVFFAISNLLSGNPNYTGVLGSITFIFLFVVPILTMRLISEETRQKTDQLLITSPLGITGIVLGQIPGRGGGVPHHAHHHADLPRHHELLRPGRAGLVGDRGRIHRVLPPGVVVHRGGFVLLLPHGQPAHCGSGDVRRAAPHLDPRLHSAERPQRRRVRVRVPCAPCHCAGCPGVLQHAQHGCRGPDAGRPGCRPRAPVRAEEAVLRRRDCSRCSTGSRC